MSKIKIWTYQYNPFTIGGIGKSPVATMIDRGELITTVTINGIEIASFRNPLVNDHWGVIELAGGAIVGSGKTASDAMRMVVTDIMAADPTVMGSQITDSIRLCENAPIINNDDFFRRLAKK